MKKFYYTCLMLAGGLFITGCGEHSAEQPPNEEEPPTIEAPSIIIPIEDAQELFDNYGKQRVPLIEEFQNVDENGEAIDPESESYVEATRSLSIDYKTLKEYMAFIESEASNAKTPITGLRIYLGLYGPKGYNPNAETVFLNPLMEYGKVGNIRDDVSFAIQEIGGNPTAVAVGNILGTFDKEEKAGGTNLEMTLQSGPVQSLAGNKLPFRPPPPPPNDPDY